MSTVLEDVARAICDELNLDFIGGSGEGTFKETYHVINQHGFNIALKVFKSGKISERTKREIDAMLVCNHPNIGKLIQVTKYEYKGQNYLYLLEEFLLGGTLTEKLKLRTMNISEFYLIGNSLIDALSHISSHGLVHRDIKPDNIMFREDGLTPVIVDFGLVRDLNSESLTQTWLMQGPGSPYFSSPEQLNNQKELIDWRSDQFSLGITFSLSLLGMHPYGFIGDDPGDVVNRIIRRSNFSTEFEHFCRECKLDVLFKMVSPWPIGRYRTPKQLKDAWNLYKV
ncbi:serine/threonine protein kinase [Cohnella algarum]|uniref:serine/threonine protein kinase n=1 Tax=Cohnella algarum TaxID=2044859 RepID=UPI0019679C6C|nr:protein kinase [Cohnella algarum]MBN2981104.1 protein kinase [Cohnella algarum]